jgi:hypothetical protein
VVARVQPAESLVFGSILAVQKILPHLNRSSINTDTPKPAGHVPASPMIPHSTLSIAASSP